MATWERKICTIRKTAGKYPQESYTMVVNSIQLEWIFIQCINWYMGEAFAGVEKMIQETFFPRLFLRNTKSLSTIVGSLSKILVKKLVLGLLNPVTLAKDKYLISHRSRAEIIQAVIGGGALSNEDHILALREERSDTQKNWDDVNYATLKGPMLQKHRFLDERMR